MPAANRGMLPFRFIGGTEKTPGGEPDGEEETVILRYRKAAIRTYRGSVTQRT